MDHNIGKKIQVVAKAILIVHVLLGLLGSGILLYYAFEEENPSLILFAISCPIIAYCIGWLSSAVFFAFGQLVENVAQIRVAAYGDKDFLKVGVSETHARKSYAQQNDEEFGDWLKNQFNSLNQ